MTSLVVTVSCNLLSQQDRAVRLFNFASDQLAEDGDVEEHERGSKQPPGRIEFFSASRLTDIHFYMIWGLYIATAHSN